MAEMSPIDVMRVPEAWYAYYRRCHVFRKNGEQCKAPAEKGASICHAHAGQRAMALRRERERQAVLTEAVAEIRGEGRPEFEMADLFMDFKSIQVTLAVMARALIQNRIDCKTAGRLLADLQTVSKLLRMNHERTKDLPLINMDNAGLEDPTTEKRNVSIDTWGHPFHQDRTGVVGDDEDASESRSKVVTESAGHAARIGNASTRNAKIVEIRRAERGPNASRVFFRHDSIPTLLTG